MKACGRCGEYRTWLVQAGYSLACSNCGGIGVVRDDGSPVMPGDAEYAELKAQSAKFVETILATKDDMKDG